MASVLERVPHGYMRLTGERIEFMNRALVTLFNDRYERLDALARCYPEVGFLGDPVEDEPPARWVDIDGTLFKVFRFPDGAATVACFLAGRELTDHDADLRSLQEAYDDFVEIFQNCFDGIYVADGKGKTLWLNDGFERCYGVSARSVIGRDASELEQGGYIKPLITHKVIDTKKRTTALQSTRSGRKVLATGIPLFDASGAVRKVIINSRDTTELVELQSRLDDAEREIERYETTLAELGKTTAAGTDLVWESARMQSVVDLARRVAQVDTTLLITGESGVGKEAVAKLIHHHGPRADGPFMQINCGAIPADLLESELLGYEAGAFTGSQQKGKKGLLELADGGTLFLDEIGEMPLALQVKLLRVLQEQTFTRLGGTKVIRTDFRIVAATNRDLKARVASGAFREDLFYRLNVVPMEVPPLRDRPEDVICLAHHFLDFFNRRYGFKKRFAAATMDRLVKHRWPGNVRELRNLVERLVVTTPGDVLAPEQLTPDALPPGWNDSGATDSELPATLPPDAIKDEVARYEARLIRRAVERLGSIRKAAEASGISESTIKRKLRAVRTPVA